MGDSAVDLKPPDVVNDSSKITMSLSVTSNPGPEEDYDNPVPKPKLIPKLDKGQGQLWPVQVTLTFKHCLICSSDLGYKRPKVPFKVGNTPLQQHQLDDKSCYSLCKLMELDESKNSDVVQLFKNSDYCSKCLQLINEICLLLTRYLALGNKLVSYKRLLKEAFIANYIEEELTTEETDRELEINSNILKEEAKKDPKLTFPTYVKLERLDDNDERLPKQEIEAEDPIFETNDFSSGLISDEDDDYSSSDSDSGGRKRYSTRSKGKSSKTTKSKAKPLSTQKTSNYKVLVHPQFSRSTAPNRILGPGSKGSQSGPTKNIYVVASSGIQSTSLKDPRYLQQLVGSSNAKVVRGSVTTVKAPLPINRGRNPPNQSTAIRRPAILKPVPQIKYTADDDELEIVYQNIKPKVASALIRRPGPTSLKVVQNAAKVLQVSKNPKEVQSAAAVLKTTIGKTEAPTTTSATSTTATEATVTTTAPATVTTTTSTALPITTTAVTTATSTPVTPVTTATSSVTVPAVTASPVKATVVTTITRTVPAVTAPKTTFTVFTNPLTPISLTAPFTTMKCKTSTTTSQAIGTKVSTSTSGTAVIGTYPYKNLTATSPPPTSSIPNSPVVTTLGPPKKRNAKKTEKDTQPSPIVIPQIPTTTTGIMRNVYSPLQTVSNQQSGHFNQYNPGFGVSQFPANTFPNYNESPDMIAPPQKKPRKPRAKKPTSASGTQTEKKSNATTPVSQPMDFNTRTEPESFSTINYSEFLRATLPPGYNIMPDPKPRDTFTPNSSATSASSFGQNSFGSQSNSSGLYGGGGNTYSNSRSNTPVQPQASYSTSQSGNSNTNQQYYSNSNVSTDRQQRPVNMAKVQQLSVITSQSSNNQSFPLSQSPAAMNLVSNKHTSQQQAINLMSPQKIAGTNLLHQNQGLSIFQQQQAVVHLIQQDLLAKQQQQQDHGHHLPHSVLSSSGVIYDNAGGFATSSGSGSGSSTPSPSQFNQYSSGGQLTSGGSRRQTSNSFGNSSPSQGNNEPKTQLNITNQLNPFQAAAAAFLANPVNVAASAGFGAILDPNNTLYSGPYQAQRGGNQQQSSVYKQTNQQQDQFSGNAQRTFQQQSGNPIFNLPNTALPTAAQLLQNQYNIANSGTSNMFTNSQIAHQNQHGNWPGHNY